MILYKHDSHNEFAWDFELIKHGIAKNFHSLLRDLELIVFSVFSQIGKFRCASLRWGKEKLVG